MSFIGFERHQTPPYDILGHLMCQRNVLCDENGLNRVESKLKSWHFFLAGRENRLCECKFRLLRPNHCCCMLSSLRYDIRRWIDETFRAFSAYPGGSMAIRVLVEFITRNFWRCERKAGGGVGPPQTITTA